MKDKIIYEDKLNILAFTILGFPAFQAMSITKPIRRKGLRIGRNEMCNCGCGRKVKYCPFIRKDSL